MAKYQYQTEVGQLLKLMTHSLYSNREIFLRELISNASDALDKFNYLHITDDKFKNEEWKPQINIKLDEEDGSIAIADNGIGMNEQDLIDNLGTTTGYYNKVWQAFTVLLNVSSVGVMGDNRTYDNTVCVRMVESVDGMTATFAHIPHDVLENISRRVINEIDGINRVVYDISSKPPATIEWE